MRALLLALAMLASACVDSVDGMTAGLPTSNPLVTVDTDGGNTHPATDAGGNNADAGPHSNPDLLEGCMPLRFSQCGDLHCDLDSEWIDGSDCILYRCSGSVASAKDCR